MMLSPSLHTETAMAKAETYAEWSEAAREQDRRRWIFVACASCPIVV